MYNTSIFFKFSQKTMRIKYVMNSILNIKVKTKMYNNVSLCVNTTLTL